MISRLQLFRVTPAATIHPTNYPIRWPNPCRHHSTSVIVFCSSNVLCPPVWPPAPVWRQRHRNPPNSRHLDNPPQMSCVWAKHRCFTVSVDPCGMWITWRAKHRPRGTAASNRIRHRCRRGTPARVPTLVWLGLRHQRTNNSKSRVAKSRTNRVPILHSTFIRYVDSIVQYK